jgi:hypothetical protein
MRKEGAALIERSATIGIVSSLHARSDGLLEPTERSHHWPIPGRCRRQRKEREPYERKPQHHGDQRVAVDLPQKAVHVLSDQRLRMGREIDRGL